MAVIADTFPVRYTFVTTARVDEYWEVNMEITLDRRLRELRQSRGNTQQELAMHLGVSVQAVSKWERNEGYPDIGLLPSIAAYYDVTVDDLLGVGKIKKRQAIDAYKQKYRSLADHTAERLDLCRQAYREFPNEPEIVHLLNCALYDDGVVAHRDEIIGLSKWLLKNSNQSGQYFGAVRNLCHLYGEQGDLETAKKYASMGGRYIGTETQLLIHILKGEEAAALCKSNIKMLVYLIAVNTRVMLEQGKFERKERIRAMEFVSGLYQELGEHEKAEKWIRRRENEEQNAQ